MSKRKLLLADDSITIQKVVNLTFADEGIEVTTVSDGDAAMEKFVENMPDLVMVDVNMPGLDGYKICEIIKQDESTTHIPVILLVGSFEPFDEEEARRVGADDYLTKPFQSIRQLVGKVTALLESNSNPVSKEESFAAAASETVETPASSASTYEIFPPASNINPVTATQFAGDEIDDEMIQTNQIGSLPVDESQRFSSDFSAEDSSQISVGKPFENSRQYESEETDWAKTQPLSEDELNRVNSGYQAQPENAATDEKVFEFPGNDSPAPEMSDENDQAASATREFSLLELDEMNLLELPFDEEENFNYQDEPLDEIEITEPADAEEAAKPADEDSPPVQETQPEVQTDTTFQANENRVNTGAETPVVAAMPESSFEQTNFSPEVIDAIAAKVVEKLSDTTIREIAWEVVPQMADLIIQKMARDKMK